jgi:hypothetical protein
LKHENADSAEAVAKMEDGTGSEGEKEKESEKIKEEVTSEESSS